MENIHGVDVSWLHRPTAGPNQANGHDSSMPNPQTPQQPKASKDERKSGSTAIETNSKAVDSPLQSSGSAQKEKRPGLLSRSGSEKSDQKRRSWMSNLTSKLSSGNLKNSDAPAQASQPSASSAKPSKATLPSSASSKTASAASDEAMEDTPSGTSPSSLKPGNPSFFSSAFRRLSTGPISQAAAGQLADKPQCKRRVLNVDEGRPRCEIKGLNQNKLRRVSFSVDVEIAGSSRYPTEEDDDEIVQANSDGKTKKKDKKIKERGEGEALKNPDAIVKSKEEEGRNPISGEKLAKEHQQAEPISGVKKLEVSMSRDQDMVSTETDYSIPKPKDEAKTSGTSKPLKEWSNTDAAFSTAAKPAIATPRVSSEAPGSLLSPPLSPTEDRRPPPAEGKPQSEDVQPTQKVQDRPTTDPLRIYRRCCQLREAPVLKRISEQLGNPNNISVESPGVVTSLNLNRSRLQYPDVVCLADWLAVVPVKKLLFDEANLEDRSIQALLAGLLAVKPPELNKRKRGRSSPTRLRDSTVHRSPGVIEKLTLKGNRKLTTEAWRHICVFLNLCRSIRAVDLSMIPFPIPDSRSGKDVEGAKPSVDIAQVLCDGLKGRLGGNTLCELTFGECGLTDYCVSKIAEGAAYIKLTRLGLAGNPIGEQGLRHVAKYLRAGVCKGLDLGGVDLHNKIHIILDAIDTKEPVQHISFSHANLAPEELTPIFKKLVTLQDFRFLDLSHNRALFSDQSSALSTLRRYLPQLHLLKRLHLMDVSLSPADVIGIAEIVPETRNLAHLNVLENPKITAVISAHDSASSEEACALYASLMTAVRLSKTMVAVDIDVPGKEATEVVRALARQVVAYCLRNMEIFAEGDAIRITDAAAALPDISNGDTGVLQDLTGHSESGADMTKLPASGKSEDYLVGGQGWVKALSHILDAGALRKMSVDGAMPTEVIESEAGKAKAKEMAKDLLSSARSFRTRLEAVLAREEASSNNFDVLKRLQFLDHTILSIIERFEREFPETRVQPARSTNLPSEPESEPVDPAMLTSTATPAYNPFFSTDHPPSQHVIDVENPPQPSSRRGSNTDLASFAQASEEAQFHRFGQRFRRDVLPPTGQEDRLHGTSRDDPSEPIYAAQLRSQLEAESGDSLREKVKAVGWEQAVKDYAEEKQRLRKQSLVGKGK